MGLLVLAALLSYEPLPSPDRILVLQEAQARLQSRSAAAEQPLKLNRTAAERILSSEERKELHRAVARFVREHEGQIVELR